MLLNPDLKLHRGRHMDVVGDAGLHHGVRTHVKLSVGKKEDGLRERPDVLKEPEPGPSSS